MDFNFLYYFAIGLFVTRTVSDNFDISQIWIDKSTVQPTSTVS